MKRARTRSLGQQQRPSALLQAYFPNCHWTLYDYIVQVIPKRFEVHNLTLHLSDLNERQSVFLTEIIVAEPTDCTQKATGITVQKSSRSGRSIGEIVNRVLEGSVKDKNAQKSLNDCSILTYGYRSININRRASHAANYAAGHLFGVENYFPNTLVNSVKTADWEFLLDLIGDAAVAHILQNTFVFQYLSNNTYCQLSGSPLTELQTTRSITFAKRPRLRSQRRDSIETETMRLTCEREKAGSPEPPAVRTHISLASLKGTEVIFDRSRTLYARPLYEKSSRYCDIAKIWLGLPRDHILNRYQPVSFTENCLYDSEATETSVILDFDANEVQFKGSNLQVSDALPTSPIANVTTHSTIIVPSQSPLDFAAQHIIKYIFPQQFRLQPSIQQAATPTNRSKSFTRATSGLSRTANTFLQDSQGDAHREQEIMHIRSTKIPPRLRIAVSMVASMIKLHHKCQYAALLNHHCPQKANTSRDGMSPTLADCSSYYEVSCYIRSCLKRTVPDAFWGSTANREVIFKSVDLFVRLRRFESISLHTILQGFKTSDCSWLVPPPKPGGKAVLPSPCELAKRKELIEEFVFWVFDSLVIPLIRTCFYVTDSGPHRNRIFYYRQDVWALISEPYMKDLTTNALEKIDPKQVNRSHLGYSYVRLLPKDEGVRPIINLRRRQRPPGVNDYDMGPTSINGILTNALQILGYEKSMQPEKAGASVLGLNEIYSHIKRWKDAHYRASERLYFAKVDIAACFDSIDQDKLCNIIQDILREDEYLVQKYGVIHPSAGKIKKSYVKSALNGDEFPQFTTVAASVAQTLRNAVLVDQVLYRYEDKGTILELLSQHINENIIKTSCSNFLDSFFYGDMEKRKLAPISERPDSVLLRYIDDFLFISKDKTVVESFVRAMYKGFPEYNCTINPKKTLVNFDMTIGDQAIPCTKETDFPWCGLLINASTLGVRGDYARYDTAFVSDGLTIDRVRNPGDAFKHKLMQMLKAKFHPIYIDTTLSTKRTVCTNIYENYHLCAMRFHVYLKEFKSAQPFSDRFLFEAIMSLLSFGYVLLRSRTSSFSGRASGCQCEIGSHELSW
ncbi:hypothetical protein BZG36_00879 [Bifiguratus adelaidae]|uniref:Telomerase reverse transcriptase n=1 Tax=Bifiguratus adelaidae TaxID=1938954 RepID=A0A261Y594_9FUNG|nr:hypothetical protein BZG36_00879 [Bifiguratus adelaidae]